MSSCNHGVPDNLRYIDKKRPNLEPKLFAKNFISTSSNSEFGSVFNKQGNEFYFAVDSAGKSKIKFSTINNTQWTRPITIISDSIYGFNDPFLSPDDSRLYYISNLPRNKFDTIPDHDIWFSNRTVDGWSKPINAGMEINSDGDEYYMSFTKDGSMYFSSNKETRNRDFDIYKSPFLNNKFMSPKKLSKSINTKRYEADVFIPPDESYMIFCAIRKDGFGRGDLYISFKDENDNWTKSKNMGEPINSTDHELCPFVSRDSKYFFYTSKQDIYWVSTEIFDLMKPEIKKSLELNSKNKNAKSKIETLNN
jgi:hypothetical protein